MEKEKVTEELVRQNGNQAAAVMADYAGQGGGAGGSALKFSDFAVMEKLTSEELELWVAANAGSGNAITGGYKINKKFLEKLCFLAPDENSEGCYVLVYPVYILEFDDAGNILGIASDYDHPSFLLAKNSSRWGSINVPDSASDDYFYSVIVSSTLL